MMFRKDCFNAHVWMVCVGLLLAGCAASGTLGRLEPSTAVDRDFENAVVLPGHAYFATGSANNPDAVIAIDGRYTLVTDRWRSVAVTERQLKEWVDRLTNMRGYGLETFGAKILGPQNQYIGVWYCAKSNVTTVKMLGDGQVMVYPPREDNRLKPTVLQKLGID